MRVLALTLTMTLLTLSAARGDAFDLYTNPVLGRLVESKNVTEVKQLTPTLVLEHDNVLPRIPSACLIVRTNGDRYAKLLVQAGKQRVSEDKALPVLIIERFVTYKEGEERQVQASGKNLSLFAGFRLSLDLGQVVPEALGGDLRFVVDGEKVYTETLGKAKLWVLNKHDVALTPKKGEKFVMGDRPDPRHFNGTFKLNDDGQRSGKLVLKVDEDRNVTGAYYSDKDGAKYDVAGKVGAKAHAIEFSVKFPRTEQVFKGMLFTGDGKVIAGTSKMVEHESAFYATREE